MPVALSIDHLNVRFERGSERAEAVRDVSLEVGAGECVALVGESGSGKTQLFMAALGLAPRHARIEGSVKFFGRQLLHAPPEVLNQVRGAEIATVFQDPTHALTPHLTVAEQLIEVLSVHAAVAAGAARAAALVMLERVGLGEPERRLNQYPHQLSGGQRQRVLIAMGLLCRPKLLVADEPTTALDVNAQAQILALFQDLKRTAELALVFISHDLAVVAGIADRIAVMYAGRIVECASTEALLRAPQHPYSAALLACMPRMHGPIEARMATLPGNPPRPGEEIPGCAFAPRCPKARSRCARERPPLATHADRSVACHFPDGA